MKKLIVPAEFLQGSDDPELEVLMGKVINQRSLEAAFYILSQTMLAEQTTDLNTVIKIKNEGQLFDEYRSWNSFAAKERCLIINDLVAQLLGDLPVTIEEIKSSGITIH